MSTKCKLCTCPNCMAGYEAEAYDYAVSMESIKIAQVQIQQSMADLRSWSGSLGTIEIEKSDAEVVKEFAEYKTTWCDKWNQLWQ